MTELTQQILDLQQGAHLCLFYNEDPAEQMPALVSFIQDALRQDERFVYVADDQTTEELVARLQASGINVGREMQHGRLQLWTRKEWRQSGQLCSERKLLQMQQILKDSEAAGFKATRFAVEMTWTLGPDIDAKGLEHWEATINTVFKPGTPGRIICQYNRSRLAPEIMLAALHTHPLAILGDEVHPNLFYRAPLILAGNGNSKRDNAGDAAAAVDWMVSQLKRGREAEKQREELIRQRAALAESERARAELERADQERRRRALELAAFVETAAVGLHWVGPDGIIQWVNAGELEMLGYCEDEYVGRHIAEFHVDKAAISDILARLRRGERLHDYEAQLKCKDGSIKDVLIDSSVLWEDGRFVHTQCFTRDFTEHKQLVADLRQLHELSSRLTTANDLEPVLREVLGAAMAIHQTDRGLLSLCDSERNGLTIGASSGFGEDFLRMIAFVPCGTGACGASYQRRERVIVEDVERDPIFAEHREAARVGGFCAVHSTPLITSERKTIRILSMHFAAPRRPSGREIRLMDLYARHAADAIEGIRLRAQLQRELAERKRAEETSRQLAAIVESSSDAIFSTTLDGVITSWNAGAEHLYGYRPEEIVGQSLATLIPKAIWDEEPRILERIRRGERVEHYETVRQRKNGRVVDVSLTVSPIKDGDGNIIGVSKIARDISGKKRAEETLRRQHQELADIDTKKNEFLAMLGHELRNPLAAIQNAVELLGEESDGSRMPWAVGVVRRQVGQLSRLVEDLLDVSRITRGRIELRRDNLDVVPVLRRAVETVRPLIEERQHTIEVSAPEETLLVSADSARLEQLLVNLLTNAAKYSDPRGLIQLCAMRDDGHIVVTVRDNGIGIAPELLSKMFDLFVQDTRGLDRARGGLGIGLALAKRLAEMHGGTLTAASDGPGCGSSFTLRLPALVVADKSRSTGPEASPQECTRAAGPRRILLVDDNQDTVQGLSRLLERRGHQVQAVYDSLEALAIAQHFEPDVFLLDLGLPGIDGYQLASELQQAGFGDALFVAISGYAQPQDIERSRRAGFQHHLAKPVDIEHITGVLNTARPRAMLKA